MWKNSLVNGGFENKMWNSTNLRTRWDGTGSVRFRFHLWPLDYHGIHRAADGRISAGVLKEQTVMGEKETEEKKRVSGDSTTVWLLARGAISRLRSHRKLQMPYFTKHLAAETKQFRLHHERLSDGNMKRKKLLRPECGCRLWSSDGFIIQQTESPNTQALRGETLRRENRETLQYGEGSRFP